MRDGYLRGTLPRTPTARQVDVLAAFVAAGGSVSEAAARTGVRPSTAKRHLADLRAKSGLTTEQPIYRGRAEGGSWSQASSDPEQAERPPSPRRGHARVTDRLAADGPSQGPAERAASAVLGTIAGRAARMPPWGHGRT